MTSPALVKLILIFITECGDELQIIITHYNL